MALIGFGIDSFLESLSGGVMVWRFRRKVALSDEEEGRIERKATRLVGYTFVILAVYVLYESIGKLRSGRIPDPSVLGILIAVVSIVVMPILFYQKYRTGKSMDNRSLVADSKETLACTFLSMALLIGLGLNYSFGYW